MLISIEVSPIDEDTLFCAILELRSGEVANNSAASEKRSVSSAVKKASGREGVPSTQAGPV
jgi:hypothetical protein